MSSQFVIVWLFENILFSSLRKEDFSRTRLRSSLDGLLLLCWSTKTTTTTQINQAEKMPLLLWPPPSFSLSFLLSIQGDLPKSNVC